MNGTQGPDPDLDLIANYKIAFDAATTRLGQQDATLTNLRGRASGLFTIAALIASFSSTIGLIGATHPLPTWGIAAALGVMAAIGICASVVLWPIGMPPAQKQWEFALDVASVREDVHLSQIAVLDQATDVMAGAIENNETKIRFRAIWYMTGTILLLVEAAVIMSAALSR